MGGRVASLLVDELAASDDVRGCLCLGYPFHPPGKPLQLRTEHLAALRTPTLILQGERDSFGRREEVETYNLSPQVQLGWIPSGDHSFKPTRSSGLSEEENWATAVALERCVPAAAARLLSPPDAYAFSQPRAFTRLPASWAASTQRWATAFGGVKDVQCTHQPHPPLGFNFCSRSAQSFS